MPTSEAVIFAPPHPRQYIGQQRLIQRCKIVPDGLQHARSWVVLYAQLKTTSLH